ncbi:group III truncated hemoglobin [Hyphococcus sp.]|jgi:hemoglobin|uniref:group III truncated hemoglobin n=1 Tax=Hyphococcus sp. TaxID=2038636 RepID=UPI003D152986
METRIRSAEERRNDIAAAAAAMGIDEEYISTLVDTFYERVRAHPLLGPVFEEKIGDDWGPHLARMKDFWASVALNAGRYSGKPVPKHKALTDVHPWHFDIWLGLFRSTLADTAPSPEAAVYFMERAVRIAESLKLAMYGLPGLGAPQSKGRS